MFVEWGGYAYGREADGVDARDVFADRLRTVEVAVHNQDNREHDIFDSDDYYQFHGGMIATRARADRAASRRPTSATARVPTLRASATSAKRPCASTASASSIRNGSTASVVTATKAAWS